jgi:hypothetical protein
MLFVKHGKEMHGKLGKALKIKFSQAGFKRFAQLNGINNCEINCGNYQPLEIHKIAPTKEWFLLPVQIANDTLGDYEVICEKGIEIHNYNEN